MGRGRVRSWAAILFALTILLIQVTVRNVYATPTILVTPSPVTQGTNFQVSGSGFSANNNFGAVVVYDDTTGMCSGLDIGQFVSSDSSGNVAAVTFSASSFGLGTHCVEMSFTSPAQVADSSVTVRAPSTTSTSVLCSPATIDVGSTSSCTATVSGTFGTITGETISWSSSGNLYFSPTTCTLSGATCTVQVTGTPPGGGSVTASYPGDSNNNPSHGTSPLTIDPAPVVTVTVTVFATTTTTVANTPEYPLGLPLLAIFMLIAYGLIRRGTRDPKNT